MLAVSGTSRAKAAPEVPTFQELGIAGIDQNPWLAFFGPKGLPGPTSWPGSASAVAGVRWPTRTSLAKLGQAGQRGRPTLPPAQLQEWVVFKGSAALGAQ
jgi:hypothetical protein